MNMIIFLAAVLFFVLQNPWLKKIFCMFGWHTWEYKKGSKRACTHCNKRQSLIRVGNDTDWK
ncbi:hypothetical protein AVU32_gp368 [Vibrio phage ValKK3]|uniref:Uncharacterized protein n=3 Tax=Schizotequatrovirus TaxID=1198137 RepID=A0A126HHF9_9CAUD|nr:hypothetical protein CF80_gp166 [Vibrio phage VH7D]YP_009201471.1 hypothetical protein AVU32_gp368 [Vibrio phage ValKK3]AGB06953.1 hypothetical protein [Vibrio phage VH7D]AJT61209.1 hypothetical protein [Vibrio phage ValKK3]ALP47311.1 hypothetical protein phiGrn1_0013 [Vibrio phage phi-Grn1]